MCMPCMFNQNVDNILSKKFTPGSSLGRTTTGPPCASFYLEADTCESRGRREVEVSLNLRASLPGAWVKPIRRS